MLLRACCVERLIFLLSSDSYAIEFTLSLEEVLTSLIHVQRASGCRVWEDETRRDERRRSVHVMLEFRF